MSNRTSRTGGTGVRWREGEDAGEILFGEIAPLVLRRKSLLISYYKTWRENTFLKGLGRLRVICIVSKNM